MCWVKPEDKFYVITRNDLPAGLQAAQSCHGIVAFSQKYPDLLKSWHDSCNFIVLLATKDLWDLQTLLSKIEEAGVPYAAFYEDNLNDELTCIALAPSQAYKLLANLPLALRGYHAETR